MDQQIKELRSDDNDPLFDKTNMLKKEFPSDFRQIRYFTLLFLVIVILILFGYL